MFDLKPDELTLNTGKIEKTEINKDLKNLKNKNRI